MKKFVALIPARSGSKGIKNKNLKKINNLNLVQIAINVAINSNIFEKIILSSDSNKILKYADGNKIIKHKRLKRHASDKSNISETIIDIKNKFNLKNNYYLFILEPTSPLRTKDQIRKAYKLIKKYNFDSFCTFTEAMISPYRVWKLKGKNLKPFMNINNIWIPRQNFETYYQAVGNIIAINLQKYNSKKGILFGKRGHMILNKIKSLDVDILDDLKIVRKVLK